MEKKVLVTGGAGFIGSALVRQLHEKGYEVTIFDDLSIGLRENLPRNRKMKLISGDVRDFGLVSSAVHDHPYVIHLAAQAFIPLSYQLPLQVTEVNVVGSMNIFKACLNQGVKRIVHVSSCEVYGSAQYIPMDEKHPIRPESTYAVTKATADMLAKTFNYEHKLPVVILRPFNIFGPRDSLPRFIPEMIRQCLKEPSIHVGNLETTRDFTYVGDTISAMIAALETEGIDGEIVNLGTNRAWKMREILGLIKKYTRTEGKEVIVDKKRLRPKDVAVSITSNGKAEKILGCKPTVDFEEGLRRTINWYRNAGMSWSYEGRGWQWRY